MPTTYKILTPVSQLRLKWIDGPTGKFPLIPIGESFAFSPMFPRLYRTLMDIAKEHQSSNDIILLLQKSEAIFWAEIPSSVVDSEMSFIDGVMYSCVADVILQKLFDCMLLFGYVPKPFPRYLWFFASASIKGIDSKSFKFLDPDWDYYDWERRYAESVQADYIVHCLRTYWDKLSPVTRIDSLNTLFTDEKKRDFYQKAGNEYIMRKTEELLKLRYGPDAHFVEDDLFDEKENNLEREPRKRLPPLSSPKLTAKWSREGYSIAYNKEIAKLDHKLYKEASGQRFIRAFQFFTNACRLENPHRFAALMASLETIFCTTPREVVFQLASRTAWFLNPSNLGKRKKDFADLKNWYDIRSKIVHGGKYSISKIENTVEDLEDLIRNIFNKILSDEKVYKLLFNKDQNCWNQYLDGLNLGEFKPE